MTTLTNPTDMKYFFGKTGAVLLLVLIMSIAAKAQTDRRFLIDFGTAGNQTTATGWNNVTDVVDGTTIDLITATGATSAIDLVVVSEPQNGFDVNGGDSNFQGYNGQVLDYPVTACNDSHYAYTTGGSYKLTGLDNTKTYDIRIFGSRLPVSDTRVALYTINGQQQTLEGANNTSQTVLFSNIVPASGVITIGFAAASGSTFGYLNVMDITEKPIVPTAPANLSGAVVSTTSVNLQWTDNSGNETGFRIERSLTSGSGYTTITTTGANATSFTDTGLTSKSTYYYRVSAVLGSANSTYATASILVNMSPVIAPLPAVIEINEGDTDVTLVTATDPENGTMVFELESAPQFVWTDYMDIDRVNLSYAPNVGVDAGVYDFKIHCTDDLGGVGTADVHMIVRAALTTPGNLSAVAVSSSGIDLSWIDLSATETGYQIERSTTSGSGFVTVTTTAANAISFSDAGLNGSTTYYYRIKAVTASASSAYTGEVSATTSVPTTPAAPTDLLATAASSTAVNLTWTDNSNNETGFKIERSLVSGTGFTVIATAAANAASYIDATVVSNKTYFYRIRAANAVGNSAYTAEKSVTTPQIPPAAPTGLTAVASSSKIISLGWIDNSNNELEFDIERSPTSGTGFTVIGTASAGNALYLDSASLASGTTYYYRVRAVNSGGFSAYSNEASAATLLEGSGSALCSSIYCTDDGNVGIGTQIVPAGFRLAVNGKMMAEGVKVALQADWPDYVFKKDYQLTDLLALKEYIDTYGHLPNMPSDEEVKKDGIDMEAINVRLLEKIEELSLYLIQVEERLKKLEEENEALKKARN